MGIEGLLKMLSPIIEKQHISSFKNQRAGVDIMPWIYHGCYSCSYDLNQNVQSIKFLYYLLEMIEILSYYGIKPIFVFDGRTVELKKNTNLKRNEKKEFYKAKGQEFLNQGNVYQAKKYFSRALFIDERIISLTVNVLITKNIDFIVAPYEADCQIAKLKKLGMIDVAISEDSDLLVYGVNTIFKLNQNGDCDYINVRKWKPKDVDSKFLKEYLAMSDMEKLQSAVLAGSDYNPSVKGIGIKRAVRNMYKQGSMKNVINKLSTILVYSDKIPEDYEKLVEKVKLLFLFATVFNPETKSLEYLNPDLLAKYKPEDMTMQQLQSLVGSKYSEYLSMQVFSGKADPKKLNVREIKPINIREIFKVNKENLCIHQTTNVRRQEDIKKIRIEREQKIEKGQIQSKEPTRTQEKIKKPKKQLTEEQKEKKKQDRKNRIVKLQDMMNAVVQMCEQEEKDPKKLPISKNIQEQKNSDIREDFSESSFSQNEDSVSRKEYVQEGQSEENVDLSFLNPFAKFKYESSGNKNGSEKK